MTPAIEDWSKRHTHKLQRHLRGSELSELQALLASGGDHAEDQLPAGTEQAEF